MAALKSRYRRSSRWWIHGTTLAVALALMVIFVAASSADLSGSTFESTDGNLIVNGGGAAEDWANAITAANITAGTASKQTDLTGSSSDNAFGQGAKEDGPNPSVVSGSIPPNKSDLSRFYTFTEKGSNGHRYLYLAWERTNVLGSANMDFELNQSKTIDANGVTPIRTAGDLLVTYDFTNGGSSISLGLLTWLTSASVPSVDSFATNSCFSSNSFPCWGDRIDASGAGKADGAINTGTVSDPIDPSAPRSLPGSTFGEEAIDLSLALPSVFGSNPTSCESFGSAFLKSRSSASFTAEMKDFIAPVGVSVSNCGRVLVHKTAQGSTAGQPGATFTIAPGSTSAGTTAPSSDIPAVSGHDGYYCVDNLLLSQNNATPAGYLVTETAAPSGYDVDPNSPFHNVLAVAGTCSGVSYTSAPTAQVEVVDPPQVGAIVITKTGKDKACTGAGTPAATCSAASTRLLNGAVFKLQTNDASKTDKYTSAATGSGTNSAGTVCIENVTPGTYNLHESTAPTGFFAAADSAVTIVAGTSCAGTGTHAPLAKGVSDDPKTTITVSTTPAVSGTTTSTVKCVNSSSSGGTDTGETSAVATPHETTALAPGTYTCTVVIDP
jgi:hypothetical protein